MFAPSHPVQGTEIANVESVVLLPHDSKDPGKAIQPTTTKDASQEYRIWSALVERVGVLFHLCIIIECVQ